MIKITNEQYAALPVEQQVLFSPGEGGYVLTVTEETIRNHPTTAGLKSALDKERSEKRALEDKNKALNGQLSQFGSVQPNELQNLLATLKNQEYQAILKDGGLEKLEAKIADRLKREYGEQIQKLQEEIEAEKGKRKATFASLAKEKKGLAIEKAIAEADIAEAHMPYVRLYLETQVVPEGEDAENLHFVAKGEDGTVRRDANGPLSMGGLIAELAKKAPDIKKSPNPIDARGNKGKPPAGGPGANPWADDSWNVNEQAKLLADDPARASSLKQQAGFSAK